MSMSAKFSTRYNEGLESLGCSFLVIRERDLKVSWTIRYDIHSPRQSDRGVLVRDTDETVEALRASLEQKFVIVDQMRGKIFTTFNPISDPTVFTVLNQVALQDQKFYTIETQGPSKSLIDFLNEAIPDPQIFSH